MLLDQVKTTIAANVQRLLATNQKGKDSRLAYAKRVGVADGSLGRYIRKEGNPTLSSLVKLAELLRIEPWELLQPIGTAQRVSEPRQEYPVSTDLLVKATSIVETILHDQKRRLSPEQRANIIAGAYEVLSEGIGMESAKRIVTNLLATVTAGEREHGIATRGTRGAGSADSSE